jgi:sec-independent protein translocase protein TatC
MAKPDSNLENELPFLAHLVELRDRLMKSVLAVAVIFLALFSFSNDIYAIFAAPILKSLPAGGTMIATGVASPFLTPFKLTMVISIYGAMPVILYQLWAFIAPGLYQHERRLVFPLVVSSIFLFYAGVAFAYFVVMPMVYKFMAAFAPTGVAWTPDISQYLSFALTMFFAFGAAFEVPIATIVLVWTGLTTPEQLASKRPYIVVAAFVIGMVLTPPDIISQSMLAIPMWLLFELGVIFSRFFVRKEDEEASREMIPGDDQHGQGDHEPEPPKDQGPDAGDEQGVSDDSGLVFADEEMNDYRQMSEEEMEAELDRIEAEELADMEEEEDVSEEEQPDKQPGEDQDDKDKQ